jgi:hypothetical protein
MTNSTEPLYVGIDVDALLAQLDQEERTRIEAASQRAVGIQPSAPSDRLCLSGRRTTSQPRLLAEDIASRFSLAGEGGVAIRSSLVA